MCEDGSRWTGDKHRRLSGSRLWGEIERTGMGAGSQEELQCSLEIKEFEAKKLFNKYLLRVYLKKI